MALQRGPSRALKLALIDGSFPDMPKGYGGSEATMKLPLDELLGLRRDAEQQASTFDVLTQQQIASLNQVRPAIMPAPEHEANLRLGTSAP